MENQLETILQKLDGLFQTVRGISSELEIIGMELSRALKRMETQALAEQALKDMRETEEPGTVRRTLTEPVNRDDFELDIF